MGPTSESERTDHHRDGVRSSRPAIDNSVPRMSSRTARSPRSMGRYGFRARNGSAARSRSQRRRRRAQRNSVARITRPSGITMIAGPGRTTSAMPKASTLPPITDTISFRATRSASGAGHPDVSHGLSGLSEGLGEPVRAEDGKARFPWSRGSEWRRRRARRPRGSCRRRSEASSPPRRRERAIDPP